jgi:hypothetical protein
LFLQRLYREWKFLFWVVLLLLPAQFFFMVKTIENVPFFLYHMYGQVHPPKDSSVACLIKTNEGYFNHKQLSSREQEMLMNPVIYYENLVKHGDGIFGTAENRFSKFVDTAGLTYLTRQLGNRPAAVATFPAWWGRYFKSISKKSYDSVWVIKSYIYTKPPYRKAPVDSIIFSIKLN